MPSRYFKYDDNQEVLTNDGEDFFQRNCKGETNSWLTLEPFEKINDDILVLKYNGVFQCFTKDEINYMLETGKDHNNSILDGNSIKIMRHFLIKDKEFTDEQLSEIEENVEDLIDRITSIIGKYKDMLSLNNNNLIRKAIDMDDFSLFLDGSIAEEDETLETLIENLGIKHRPGKNTPMSDEYFKNLKKGFFKKNKFKNLVSSVKMKKYRENIHKYCKQIITRLEEIIIELETFKSDINKKTIDDFLTNPSVFWSLRVDVGVPLIEIQGLTLLYKEFEKINLEFV